MSILTTLISNKQREDIIALQDKLQKVMKLLHAKNEIETIDVALGKVITELEGKDSNGAAEKDFDVDVRELNRIPPRSGFTVNANFKIVGRRKPMRYDFQDSEADAE